MSIFTDPAYAESIRRSFQERIRTEGFFRERPTGGPDVFQFHRKRKDINEPPRRTAAPDTSGRVFLRPSRTKDGAYEVHMPRSAVSGDRRLVDAETGLPVQVHPRSPKEREIIHARYQRIADFFAHL